VTRPPRLLVAWAVLVFALAIRAFAGGVLPPPPGSTVSPLAIDPNRAPLGELQALPGIGPRHAEAIVLERIRRGPFRRPEDLLRVDGIGPERLQVMLPFLALSAASPPPERR